ncbi:putative transmembrane protein [Hyphomicrobiales bacterium]|nr:putative transmembrane protein [Hyphomicrobiales bacterium]CAH1674757.1 putative transmembrane protein [Hyphomicrobiales bacterium]
MASMDGIPMPGGWMMSPAWLPMCGQTWREAAASFVGLWSVMMVAMMVPSLLPALGRYHQAAGLSGASWPGSLAMLAGVVYLGVWTLSGLFIFAIGSELAALAMRRPDLARAMPMLMGACLLTAGAFQFTRWKARLLACCRKGPCRIGQLANRFAAAGYGLRLGLVCCISCSGLVAVLLVLGVMDLRAMILVTLAITTERLAPAGLRMPEAIGAVTAGAGGILIAQAAGFV